MREEREKRRGHEKRVELRLEQHSPTAETEAGAGEVLIREETAVRDELV